MAAGVFQALNAVNGQFLAIRLFQFEQQGEPLQAELRITFNVS